MIKKTITFEDFNGNTKTQDFYFHLSKMDQAEFSLEHGFEDEMKRALASGDRLRIFRAFKRMLELSVGMRTEDGSGFVKTPEYTSQFINSPAADELVIELLQDNARKTPEFMAGILPKDQSELMKEEFAKIDLGQSIDPFEENPVWIREKREPTQAELRSMTAEQLRQVYSRKMQNKS